MIFRWLKNRRQRAHLAQVARVLESENERLLRESCRLRAENSELERRLAGQDESLVVLNDCVIRLNAIHAKQQGAQ